MITHFKSKHLEQTESLASALTPDQKDSFYKGVIGYGLLSGIPRSELVAACAAMATDGSICSSVLMKQ